MSKKEKIVSGKYIEEYLTWDATSDKFLDLYNSVL